MQIVEQGLMSKEDYDFVAEKALALFAHGQVRLSNLAALHWLGSTHKLVVQQTDCTFWKPVLRGSAKDLTG